MTYDDMQFPHGVLMGDALWIVQRRRALREEMARMTERDAEVREEQRKAMTTALRRRWWEVWP